MIEFLKNTFCYIFLFGSMTLNLAVLIHLYSNPMVNHLQITSSSTLLLFCMLSIINIVSIILFFILPDEVL